MTPREERLARSDARRQGQEDQALRPEEQEDPDTTDAMLAAIRHLGEKFSYSVRPKVPHVKVVMDAQYGSCGKGAFCQWLASRDRPAVAVRTGGPNAGHSVLVRDPESGAYDGVALRHLPAAAVACDQTVLVIPAAGLIHPETLFEEISLLESYGVDVSHRLVVDPLATVIVERHQEQERSAALRERVGSTREGVGAAQAEKVMRSAPVARDVESLRPYLASARHFVQNAPSVHVETTQGVGLGLHFGHYPFATSRDISTSQALADVGLSPTAVDNLEVLLLARTFPIRVAGNSGPFGGTEVSWEDLKVRTGGWVGQAEQTTVTGLERRVAEWSTEEVYDAVKLTGATSGVLAFADYAWPEVVREVLRLPEGASLQDTPRGWHADLRVLSELASRTNRLYQEGRLEQYDRAYRPWGQIDFLSWGFGAVVPVFRD